MRAGAAENCCSFLWQLGLRIGPKEQKNKQLFPVLRSKTFFQTPATGYVLPNWAVPEIYVFLFDTGLLG